MGTVVVPTANDNDVGESIPPLTAHAVSVSLPTWSANVGYEEGQEWVISKMKTGYPRFFINKIIEGLAQAIVDRFGSVDERAMVFPSHAVAARCLKFLRRQTSFLPNSVRILDLISDHEKMGQTWSNKASPKLSAVIFPSDMFSTAKTFWQHSGDGISSRRAEFAHRALDEGILVEKREAQEVLRPCKGPRRYQRSSLDITHNTVTRSIVGPATPRTKDAADGQEQYVEERFGRNLDLSYAAKAKLAIRRRIAGSLTIDAELTEALQADKDEAHTRKVTGFSVDDVYLYPTGMSAIFNSHRSLLAARGEAKSIMYGFPYIDTLKILEKFGPGCLFYGSGSANDLDDLESRLQAGETYLALFCEFPGNPLLTSPNLVRIRDLAIKYNFAVVVDETIGNFLNVQVLPYADVVVSSLTKIFSGDSNVMGGSAILNPNGPYYQLLKGVWNMEYEDNYWVEDALFMERNSRDFVSRNERINANAEAICDVLRSHPKVKQLNYPKYSSTRQYYEQCRSSNGGYGGLLSATFHSRSEAIAFYDNLDTAKGPSLGTNFTLSSPYVILAHYNELDWVSSLGIQPDLIRFSVGLEDTDELVATFKRALLAAENVS